MIIRLGSEPSNPDADPDSPAGKVEKILYQLTECPVSYITQESLDVLEIYNLHERYGGLPYPGTILQQPALLMDALEICRIEFDKVLRWKSRPKKKRPTRKREQD